MSEQNKIGTLTVTIRGIRPLIMSNPQTVKISSAYATTARELNKQLKAHRKANDENLLLEDEKKQMRNDWESSAYWDAEEKRFYIPDTMMLACIRSGATADKKGRDIDRCVTTVEAQIFLDTTAHKSLEAAYADPAFRLEGPCKIPPKTGSLIWKCRCCIPTGWRATFNLEFDAGIIAKASLESAILNAGRLCGIGGWRPKFGRFLVE